MGEPQEIEITFDEEPDSKVIYPGQDFNFIFLVDRSGSMGGWGGSSRISVANDALKLFLRSLPEGCTFSILGFGTSFDWYEDNGQNQIHYNEETMQRALTKVSNQEADLGGTDILTPLGYAQDLKSTKDGRELFKRVFILTDGQVGNNN